MENKVIGVASDHAGFPLKQFVVQYLEEKGLKYKDFGTYSDRSCDYPDFAHPLADDIEAGVVSTGIAICGSGEGMTMTLNKHHGVRAGLAWNVEISHLIRQHNDANCLVLPGRFITNREAAVIIDEFLKTPFEAGRHQLRIDKM
ncbi:MAG: RpiB/LacA/LacB family sugar-phosphate isomerase [Prevotella sp.]|nr:RpiB/LacA/LacB family sugar-phosphate isomerase [Prevotella sp.]